MKLLKKLYQYVVPLMLLFQMQLESSTYKGSQSSRPSAGDKGFFNALRAYSVQGELSTPIHLSCEDTRFRWKVVFARRENRYYAFCRDVRRALYLIRPVLCLGTYCICGYHSVEGDTLRIAENVKSESFVEVAEKF